MDWKKPRPEEAAIFDAALPKDERVKRVKMFGFPHGKVGDYMFAGRHGRGITVRLPEAAQQELLRQGATPFEPMPGRPMKGWVLLPPSLERDPSALSSWVRRAFEHALTLPPKRAKPAESKAPKAGKVPKRSTRSSR
jgi:hypothetical protein